MRDQLVLDVPPAEREFAEQYLWGYPLALLQQPHAYNRGNYSSYDIEHGLRSVADLDRQLQLGYIEGPLHYAPRIINPQGGVYLAHKDKYRPVLDCSVSGLNGLLAPQECKYDMFEDMLARVHPDDSQSGFDLKDAFYNWPRVQRECDLLGLQGPPGRAGYYRYRFTSMGLADSPSLQQRWMRIIQGMMNSELSTLCQQQRSARPHSGRDAEVAATFVDDAHALHPVEYNDTEKQQQFDLLIDFLQRYNIVDSPAKREPPQNPKVYVGLEADTHTMTARIHPSRAQRLQQQLQETEQQLQGSTTINRRQLSSIIGKVQFCASVAPQLQAGLGQLYRTRDHIAWSTVPSSTRPGSTDLSRLWGRSVEVTHSPADQRALQDLQAVLANPAHCERRFYRDSDSEPAGFWTGQTSASHEYMDRHSATEHGVPVYTGDASGDGGAAWCGDLREVWKFAEHECAPHQSSNFRELKTAVQPLRKWGPRFRGRRLLYRSDNRTTVSVIRRKGTTARNLQPLVQELRQLCLQHDIDLAALHIPGKENGLADRLSRFTRTVDTGDWKLHTHIFEAAQQRALQLYPHMQPITLDGTADPAGQNAHVPRFCSAADSLLDRNLAGESVWANPDFSKLPEMLGHLRQQQASSPTDTSLLINVPEWPHVHKGSTQQAPWWKYMRGGQVLARFPAGSHLYTSPDWQGLRRWDGSHEFGQARVYRGDTRWPVLIVAFPPAVTCRSSAEVRRRRAGAMGEPGGHSSALYTLHGDSAIDLPHLHRLPDGFV